MDQSHADQRTVNVALSAQLLGEAESLGADVPQAAERGLQTEIARARAERWIGRDRAAMEC